MLEFVGQPKQEQLPDSEDGAKNDQDDRNGNYCN